MTTVNIKYIIGCLASQMYKLHPYCNPPKASKIIKYFTEELRKECKTPEYIEVSPEEFMSKMKSILMGCLEFRQLNISRHRWNCGQRDIYDESKYRDMKSNDIQENDFIDLDVLIRNMHNEFWTLRSSDDDCFLCKFAKEYVSMEPSDCEQCKNCLHRPGIRDNRVTHPWALLPKNSDEYQELVKTGKIKWQDL